MELKDRILHYLADGLKPAQIISMCGCSAGYISQLIKNEDFQAKLSELIANNPKPVEDTLEVRYHGLESDLINAMRDAIPSADLPAITRAMQTVADISDKRHARKHPAFSGQPQITTIVQLSLPAYAIPRQPAVVLNSQQEIVAINDQALAPLPADGVRRLFEARKLAKNGQDNDFLDNKNS